MNANLFVFTNYVGTRETEESVMADITRVNEARRYPFKLSVSMGGSGWKAREIESLDDLIEQADKEMYAEKRAKKNS